MSIRDALLGALALAMVGLAPPALLHAETPTLNTGAHGLAGDQERHISLHIVRGITRSKQLPPHLVQARKALLRQQPIRQSSLRALADLGDGLAAYRLARQLDLETRPELAADAAHYFGIAAATGRGGAIHGLIRALNQTDPATTSQARLDVLRDVLVAYAAAGSPPALEALMRFHKSAVPFGSMSEEFEAMALQEGSPGSSAVALQLASELLQAGTATRAELEQARDYLQIAATADSLRRRSIATNLLPKVEAQLAALPPKNSAENTDPPATTGVSQ